MAALEVLTDEGVKALNEAVASGYRLVVEFASIGSKENLLVGGSPVSETIQSYAQLNAADNAAWASDSYSHMPCVALLPSNIEPDEDSLEAVTGLDAEFSWLPAGNEEFDAIAIFARMYRPYAKYMIGDYTEGSIVWYREGTQTTFYRCIADVYVPEASYSPASDPTHWEEVEMTDLVIDSNPPLRATSGADSLVLLHVSTTEQPVSVCQGLELNYKLRLLMNAQAFNLAGTTRYPIYLESLVPAGDAALQLDFLKEMSQTMATMREIIADAYGR